MSDAPNKPAIHITEQYIERDGRKMLRPITSEICDFCGDATPAWDYDARDFAIPNLNFGSAGGWAACEQCSTWIEDDEWQKLASRSVFGRPNSLDTEMLRRRSLRIHQGFRENRIGERVPHQEGEMWSRIDSSTP
jgi:hypothetical protein